MTAACLTSLAIPTRGWTASKLRVASFNLHNKPWRRRDRLVTARETLRSLSLDVAALQEVATGWWLPGDPLGILAPALSGKVFTERAWHEENIGVFKTGLGLLSRHPITEAEYTEFSRNSFLDPKGFLAATINGFQIINAHLSPDEDKAFKATELADLSRGIAARIDKGPVILLADFNLHHASAQLRAFLEQWKAASVLERLPPTRVTSTWAPYNESPCHESAQPGQTIDNVVLVAGRHRITLVDGGIQPAAAEPRASDHCPVYAEVTWE